MNLYKIGKASLEKKKWKAGLNQDIYRDKVIALILKAGTLLTKPKAAPIEEKYSCAWLNKPIAYLSFTLGCSGAYQ